MPELARGFGGGKLILVGEHAVVYGHPAIAFAVDRGTTVVLDTGAVRSDAIDVADGRLTSAIDAILGGGYGIEIHSDLPIGRGMGSSAALAVALVRARAALNREELDADEVFERAMPVERIFHGNPSGLDVAVSARGGVLLYRKGPPPVFEPLPTPSWQVVVMDSGRAGNTRELVAGVASRRPAIDPVLERIGGLAARAAGILDDVEALGTLLDENHELLRQIGVSTPRLDELVGLARAHGAAGAKLSGAGGGGVVIALVRGPEPLLDACEIAGVSAFACRPVGGR